MIYEIRHRLDYRYSLPVYLEPHRTHIIPRSDAFQRLLNFDFKVEPEPSCIAHTTDSLGNPAQQIWFTGRSDRLSVESFSRVETLCSNPFSYLLDDSSVCLPLVYPYETEVQLALYFNKRGEDPAIVKFAGDIAKKTGYETIGFLSELCLEIHRMILYCRRDAGFPLPPAKTFSEKKGSCRDLAVLFMACCRSQGLAARFTSGYIFSKTEALQNDLHAWAEVYLEGGGWRGYDPSTGLVAGEQHIALASAPEAKFVTPVAGTFRALGAVTELHTHVNISLLTEEASAL